LAWAAAGLLAWAMASLAWPALWRLVILPASQAGQGFQATSYDQENARGRRTGSQKAAEADFRLDAPNSSLQAWAVWEVPADGLYQLRLDCDDYGSLRVDNHILIELWGVNAHNQGQAEVRLEAGPHLLLLELDNRQGAGWLKASYRPAGQGEFRLFGGPELRLVELGNLPAWLKAAAWLQVLPWWALAAGLMVWLAWLLLGWVGSRPPAALAAGGSPPRPPLRLRWVLAALALALAGLAAAEAHLHGVYDQQGESYNRRGYRGPLAGPKAPGEFRVAVFGGSGSYGYGQRLQDSWPEKLDRLLAKGDCPVRVINLSANQQGIYGMNHDVRIYQDLGYDLALLYLGGADSSPTQPHLADFRGANPVFAALGYMPILTRYLEEKQLELAGDLGRAAWAAGVGHDWAVGAPVRFILGQAATQAGQMLERMGKTLSVSEKQARVLKTSGRDRPFAFFLDYTERTLDWLLSHDKRVVCLGEAALSGSLQQELLVDLIQRKYAGRVTYLDAAKLIDAPAQEAFTDLVHFTQNGARLLASALAPRLREIAGCPEPLSAPPAPGGGAPGLE
jgi:lysophospholipase L1-like esterase